MSNPHPSTDTKPMQMVSVPDGNGGSRLELRPRQPSKQGGKKARHIPDPIQANPDAAAQDLAQIVERIERLEEEKQGVIDDIRDVYSEGRSKGYDAKAVRTIVKLRKMQPNDRQENEAILETYKAALGLA